MLRVGRWLRAQPWMGDVALILLLLVPAGFQTGHGWQPAWVRAVILAGLAAPMLWHRRYPAAAAATVLTAAWALYATQAFGHQLPVAVLALDLIVGTLVRQGRRGLALLAGGTATVFYLSCVLSWFPPHEWLASVVGHLLLLALAWVVGELVRARRCYDAEVARRATLADAQRQALARAALAEERNRIARELHDVLAHSVSVMVVNAEGALLMRRSDPDVVDRTLETISATGRAALGELRRLVDVLHAGPSPREPQPKAADLRDLVARVSVGRPEVALVVTGDEEGLPASATLQTYRIVQEALTNVVKHAPADADAAVRVDLGTPGERRRIRIEVTNRGGDVPPAVTLPASGRGLAGMRERVSLFSGTVDAGPTGEGGYRVAATLHVGPA